MCGSRIIINLKALAQNWQTINKIAKNAECAAVVKANAYGCGIEQVVKTLKQQGCKTFFVATTEEAIRVRSVSKNVVVYCLNGINNNHNLLLRHNVRPVINSIKEAREWKKIIRNKKTKPKCAVHIDTGMNRLGVDVSEVAEIKKLKNEIKLRLLMTHYANAEQKNNKKNKTQKTKFINATKQMPDVPLSMNNSAAILNGFDMFNLVRPGIALYGAEAVINKNPMKNVVSMKTKIFFVRDVKKGETVGYGSTQKLQKDSVIAYVSAGYADGYQRNASNCGTPMRKIQKPPKAIYKNKSVSGVGRISMDMSAFDVTNVKNVKIGDEVELFGDKYNVDKLAKAAGTIGYEILTNAGGAAGRTKIVYV